MGKKSQPSNRSRTPQSKAFLKYIASNWDDSQEKEAPRWEVANFTEKRRAELAKQFKGKVLLIEAGQPKVRSNDDEYRYRPFSGFAHLTGWGSATVPGSVLVIDARKTKVHSTLYLMPTADKTSDEFFANNMIGEFWVGARPSLLQVANQLGIETEYLAKLPKHLEKLGKVVTPKNAKLAEALSTLRFIKDDYEISQMREAVNVTIRGFGDVARSLPKAKTHPGVSAWWRRHFSPGHVLRAMTSVTAPSQPPAHTPALCTGPTTTVR